MPKGKHKRTKKLRKKLSKITVKENYGKWMKGRKLPEKTRKKMSKMKKGHKSTFRGIGKLNPNWQGGKSFEPYTTDWTTTLRRSIRERDKYTCQLCGALQSDKAFCVHHIDYDKKNCSPDNLITLCEKCHKKTNYNRKYWIKLFKNL